MIELINADVLHPAAYNPREADPERLDMVELSIRKLEWLLPIYVAETDEGTEILSGHQRHLVATERLGYRQVPIVRISMDGFNDRRLVNIAFNRGTNDFLASDTSKTVTLELIRANVLDLAAALPDLDPDDPAALACLVTKTRPIADFVDSCSGRWSDHAARVNRLLVDKGVTMPVVVSGNDVINGVGRVQRAAEAGATEIQAIEIPAERAALARAMMNLLSMDFTIHERYADLLRYSNGRRWRSLRHLNLCMIYAMDPDMASKRFDHEDPAVRRKWRRFYGKTVLDFGAGSGVDTEILGTMGVDSTPFEPWAYDARRASNDAGGGSDQEDLDFDLDESRARVRSFLEKVRATSWDSIFMASVLNSVPFDADRRHLVTLIAALATSSKRTKVYPVAASYKNPVNRHVQGGDYVNGPIADLLNFSLDYEPRTSMTSFDRAAKTQRYFTGAEFFDLWSERFERVKVDSHHTGLIRGWVMTPKPLAWDDVEAAIRFEFDLPFPKGQRLDLVEEALESFWERRKAFAIRLTV